MLVSSFLVVSLLPFVNFLSMKSSRRNGHKLHARTQENNSVRTGNRPPIYFEKCVYTGEWKNNQKHGRGVMRWSSAVYSGEWCRDQFSGHGVYIRHDADLRRCSKYDGFWHRGCRQGYGVQLYSDGRSYRGEWLNGARTGSGVMHYPDGSVYDGHWFNGFRHGQGTQRLANGDVYEGSWQDGRRHGVGCLKAAATGLVIHGLWCDGLLRCSTMDDQSRATALSPLSYAIPPLQLANAEAVMKEAIEYYHPEGLSDVQINRIRRQYSDSDYGN